MYLHGNLHERFTGYPSSSIFNWYQNSSSGVNSVNGSFISNMSWSILFGFIFVIFVVQKKKKKFFFPCGDFSMEFIARPTASWGTITTWVYRPKIHCKGQNMLPKDHLTYLLLRTCYLNLMGIKNKIKFGLHSFLPCGCIQVAFVMLFQRKSILHPFYFKT